MKRSVKVALVDSAGKLSHRKQMECWPTHCPHLVLVHSTFRTSTGKETVRKDLYSVIHVPTGYTAARSLTSRHQARQFAHIIAELPFKWESKHRPSFVKAMKRLPTPVKEWIRNFR